MIEVKDLIRVVTNFSEKSRSLDILVTQISELASFEIFSERK